MSLYLITAVYESCADGSWQPAGAHVEEVRSKYKYEHDLYWTHQLFSEKWDPGLPHIVDEIPA